MPGDGLTGDLLECLDLLSYRSIRLIVRFILSAKSMLSMYFSNSILKIIIF